MFILGHLGAIPGVGGFFILDHLGAILGVGGFAVFTQGSETIAELVAVTETRDRRPDR